MSDVASSFWTEHVAKYRGRVIGFERRVRMAPKVPDDGIDLRRNKSIGVTGWQAENTRLKAEGERQKARAHELIEAMKARAIAIPKLVERPGPPTLHDIQDAVCRFVGIPRSELLAFRRNRECVKPRQIAILICKMLTTKSLPEIGRDFANRDHTTILHGCRKIEKQRHTDEKLASELSVLEALFV